MICKKCNKNIDNDAKFCTYCGEKVHIKEDETIQIEQNIEKQEFNKIDENISNNETEILKQQNVTPFKEFFYSHHGSIGRKEFFFRGFLPLSMILIILMAISNISLSIFTTYFQVNSETLAPVGFIKFLNYAVILLSFFIFVIISNVSVKRLHDTNNNGWWAILNLVPLINLLLLLFLFFAPSKKDNIYGVKNEYILNSKKILISIFYILIIFIMLAISSFSKSITNLNLNEKIQKNTSQEKKESTIKNENDEMLKNFNVTLALAEQGLAEAQYNLGLMYVLRYGVEQDYKKAIEWYEKAANQGHAKAQFILGDMYSSGQGVRQDYKKAAEWYEKAATQGDANAQYNLGLMYLVKQDYKKAFEWFEKAASQGNTTAQYNLGLMYYNGQGVRQDYKKAAEWY